MPEITEAQANAVKLYEQLFNHSDVEVRNKVRAHVKQQFPNVQLPTDEIEPLVAPLRAENEALKERFAKLEAAEAERAKADADRNALNAMAGQLETAVKEYNLTDDGRAKMIERMSQTGNYSDPAAAAAWVASKVPPPPPPVPGWAPQNMNLFGSAEKDDQFASLHKNPEKYMDDQLMAFVRDPEGYTRETLGQ